MKVYKYELKQTGRTTLQIPQNSKILHVGIQDNKCCLWVKVNPESPVITKKFISLLTGEKIPDFAEYLGTLLWGETQSFVTHVFELGLI